MKYKLLARLNSHPVVVFLGVLASLLGIFTFLFEFYGSVDESSKPQSVDREMTELLMGAVHELDSNSEYLNALKAYWLEPSGHNMPIGSVDYSETRAFFLRYFDVVTQEVYGEEDKLIWLVSLADGGSKKIEEDLGRLTLEEFDSKYNMTFDDVRLVNGFLSWYLGHLADAYLPREFLISMLRPQARLMMVGAKYEMREFIIDGEPITEYSHLLGLLD